MKASLIVAVWLSVGLAAGGAFLVLRPFSSDPVPQPGPGPGTQPVPVPAATLDLDNKSVVEESPGAHVGAVTITNPHEGGYEFAVSDARFEVAGGRLKLKDSQSLRRADGASVDLTITATDKSGTPVSKQFTIAVDEVDAVSSPTKGPQKIPYITWGGDVATFFANGGELTKSDSIYGKLGLNLELVNGDNFDQQVADYLAGKSDFLRGTFSMLGEVSEKVNADPANQAVVFLQLTWSAGDHMVAREPIRSLQDLRGKMVALQKSGPHVGMLDDTLWSANLTWNDITPVWVDDLTGDNGPAARFKSDPRIAACMVISPDMAMLTGDYDLNSIGTGEGDSVKGAHVLNSTAWMSRSICDVYACRKSYYDAHRDVVENFAAGYLKGCEELLVAKKDFEDEKPADRYTATLKMAQDILGTEALPTPDDAHGLISDCEMVLLSGNRDFFTNDLFFNNFEDKQQKVIDLAISQGAAKGTYPYLKPNFDYDRIKSIPPLTDERPPSAAPAPGPGGTIYSFDILFPVSDDKFDPAEFEKQFERAAELSELYGGAIIAVRGHVDPSKFLIEFFKAAEDEGYVVKRDGKRYYLDQEIDPSNSRKLAELAETLQFPKALVKPKDILNEAASLSEKRAGRVRQAVLDLARKRGIRLNANQFRSVGLGVSAPLHPVPKTIEEQTENRRVEFRIIRISPESEVLPGDL